MHDNSPVMVKMRFSVESSGVENGGTECSVQVMKETVHEFIADCERLYLLVVYLLLV